MVKKKLLTVAGSCALATAAASGYVGDKNAVNPRGK